MPGAGRTRSLVCEVKKHTSIVTTGIAETLGHSLRNGFFGCSVISPVNQLFCHRRLSIISTSLSPAWAGQDHTA
jgi:hypothetical protein